jgi:hypothetical protein
MPCECPSCTDTPESAHQDAQADLSWRMSLLQRRRFELLSQLRACDEEHARQTPRTHTLQSVNNNVGIRPKSRPLQVTTVALNSSAVAAIFRSLLLTFRR